MLIHEYNQPTDIICHITCKVATLRAGRLLRAKPPLTNNTTAIHDIDKALASHNFDTPYCIGEFDCLESSYAVFTLLRAQGYDAYVMYRIVPSWSSEESHAWVVVKVDGAYAVIETTLWNFGVDAIGGVVIPEDVNVYHTDSGYMTTEPKEYLDQYGFGYRLEKDIMGHVKALAEPTPGSPR